MLVFKPRLALVYAMALVIITLVSNRITVTSAVAQATSSTLLISTMVEASK